jgi:hypothetical protein
VHRRLRDERRKRVATRDVALALLGICTLSGAAIEASFSYGAGRYILPFVPLACVVYGGIVWAACRGSAYRFGRIPFAIAVVAAVALDIGTVAFAFGQGPKSGIAAIATSDPAELHAPRTAYLAAPDYIAPTVAYYTHRDVPLYGFGRWDHPEIFRVAGYADAWRRSDLVSSTLSRIDGLRRNGYTRLVVIRGERADVSIADQGSMRYSRTEEMLSALRRRYVAVRQIDVPAFKESAVLEVFDLTSRSHDQAVEGRTRT